MFNIQSIIQNQVSDVVANKIGGSLGLPEGVSKSIARKVAPLLMAGMARKNKSKEGAESLLGALKKDHDGDVLGNIDGLLGNPEAAKGNKILGHILGGNGAQQAAEAIAQEEGVDAEQVKKYMEMMAPVTMGALGKEVKEKGMGVEDIQAMMQAEQEREEKEEKNNPLMKMVMGQFDKDGDGDMDKDDVMKMGMNAIKKQIGLG